MRTCFLHAAAYDIVLLILEGNDDKKEIVPENESETAAEGEIRREKDLDNDLMLGMLTDYGDESKIIKYQKLIVIKKLDKLSL